MPRRILVATDGSTLSDKAVADAIALSSQCEAELVVLTVVPDYATALFEGANTFSADDIGRAEARCAEAARTTLDRAMAGAHAAGVRARAFALPSEDVAASILAAATKHDCDLIVMASHGRKGIRRLLLGSETQHVLAAARMPVLVVR